MRAGPGTAAPLRGVRGRATLSHGRPQRAAALCVRAQQRQQLGQMDVAAAARLLGLEHGYSRAEVRGGLAGCFSRCAANH